MRHYAITCNKEDLLYHSLSACFLLAGIVKGVSAAMVGVGVPLSIDTSRQASARKPSEG